MKNNYHILVIDDLHSIHQDFKKILTPEIDENYRRLEEMKTLISGTSAQQSKLPSFELEFAIQGLEGVALVNKALSNNTPFAAVFVDVQMPPGEDGIETINRIWEIDKEIQTVICTAYAKYTWEDLRKKFGDTDRLFVLKKPFDNLEIIQLACSLCKKWNLHKLQKPHQHASVATESTASKAHNNTMDRLNDAMNILSNLNNKLKNPVE